MQSPFSLISIYCISSRLYFIANECVNGTIWLNIKLNNVQPRDQSFSALETCLFNLKYTSTFYTLALEAVHDVSDTNGVPKVSQE